MHMLLEYGGSVSVVTISISRQLMVATVICKKYNDQCTQIGLPKVFCCIHEFYM